MKTGNAVAYIGVDGNNLVTKFNVQNKLFKEAKQCDDLEKLKNYVERLHWLFKITADQSLKLAGLKKV